MLIVEPYCGTGRFSHGSTTCLSKISTPAAIFYLISKISWIIKFFKFIIEINNHQTGNGVSIAVILNLTSHLYCGKLRTLKKIFLCNSTNLRQSRNKILRLRLRNNGFSFDQQRQMGQAFCRIMANYGAVRGGGV
jgi:hypothetical protein